MQKAFKNKQQQNVGSNYEYKHTNKSMSIDYDNSSKPQVICWTFMHYLKVSKDFFFSIKFEFYDSS